jgi:hypothetical protein
MADSGEKDSIRKKRTQTLVGVWEILVQNKEIDQEYLELSYALVNEAVEHYLADLDIIKLRYNIKGRIQLHKVAGLMTGAIMRFRPVVPIKKEFPTPISMYANEILAIYHGLAICGEHVRRNERISVSEEPWFASWLKDFLYLLHHRNYTPESISFIYQTLCYSQFPSSFDLSGD